MNQDMDVRSYFMERAPKSGPKAAAWNRAVGVLLRNGVNTMQELGEKEYDWILPLFVNMRDDKKELDSESLDVAADIREKYLAAVHKAELLAAGEVLVKDWFSTHAPRTALKGTITRAVKALQRGDIETMSALCGAKTEDLAKIRNMGGKSLALTLLMCEKYKAER